MIIFLLSITGTCDSYPNVRQAPGRAGAAVEAARAVAVLDCNAVLRGRLPQRREFHGAEPAGLRAAVEVGRDAGRVLRERDQSAC